LADKRLKINHRKALLAADQPGQGSLGYFYKHFEKPRESLEVKQGIAGYLDSHGVYDLKCLKVQEHLQETMPEVRPPTLNDIGAILKQDFQLRYRRYDGATVRYKDPQFDEKRLWACRLLSQFLLDDALIISIDESHMRSDKAKQYQWQFLGSDRIVHQMMRQKVGLPVQEE